MESTNRFGSTRLILTRKHAGEGGKERGRGGEGEGEGERTKEERGEREGEERRKSVGTSMYVCKYVSYVYIHTYYVLIKPPMPYIASSPLCLLRGFAS